MMPETDLEYLLYGEPEYICERLVSLGLLSDHGVAKMQEVRTMIGFVQAEYEARPLRGPSHVHRVAANLIEMGAVSELGLSMHAKGSRSYSERWNDEEYMRFIGEEAKYHETQERETRRRQRKRGDT